MPAAAPHTALLPLPAQPMSDGLPASSIIDAEDLYEILQRNTRLRNGKMTVKTEDVVEDMKRPGNLGFYRDHSERTPSAVYQPAPPTTAPVRPIVPENDTSPDHMRMQYLQIRRELFEDDEDAAAEALPLSSALAAESVRPEQRTRSRHASTLAAKPARPPPETWLSSLRSGGSEVPPSSHGMTHVGSAYSLRQVGSASALSTRQRFTSPPHTAATRCTTAPGDQLGAVTSPSTSPLAASSPLGDTPPRANADRATTGMATRPMDSNPGSCGGVASLRAGVAAQPGFDVERALEQPRSLAARAAWARKLADSPPRGTAAQIAAGRVPPLPRDDDDGLSPPAARDPPLSWTQARPLMELAAKGGGVMVGAEDELRWSPKLQSKLNGLDERVRFDNLLDRFEAFNRVRANARKPAPTPPARTAWGAPPSEEEIGAAGGFAPGGISPAARRRAAELIPGQMSDLYKQGKRRPS